MTSSLHAFMQGLVDYAGLFPPAALGVPDAVAEFAGHQNSPEAWMLGRFIAPAGALPSIVQAAGPHLGNGPLWPVSVIVGNRESCQKALAGLEAQGRTVAEAVKGGLKVEVLETPLPADAVTREDVAAFLRDFGPGLANAGMDGYELFIEVKPGREAAGILAEIAVFGAEGKSRVGAKLRTGGLEAGAFPSCDEIAGIIAGCRHEQLPMKFTAGLHHPLRHRNEEIGVMMHGFLNVFGAGVLAHAHDLSPADISAILAETDPSAFTFSETAFAWRHLMVELSTLKTLRSQFLCGFGSCSFTEPRDDLFGLALL